MLILRFLAVKQRVDALMLAEYFKMSEKAAAMRFFRCHRQGPVHRSNVLPLGRRAYTLTEKGWERVLYIAKVTMLTP